MGYVNYFLSVAIIIIYFSRIYGQADICGGHRNPPEQCVVLRDCQHIIFSPSYNQHRVPVETPWQLPLAAEVIAILRLAHCGYQQNVPKVCCPRVKDKPYAVEEPVSSSNITAEEQFPKYSTASHDITNVHYKTSHTKSTTELSETLPSSSLSPVQVHTIIPKSSNVNSSGNPPLYNLTDPNYDETKRQDYNITLTKPAIELSTTIQPDGLTPFQRDVVSLKQNNSITLPSTSSNQSVPLEINGWRPNNEWVNGGKDNLINNDSVNTVQENNNAVNIVPTDSVITETTPKPWEPENDWQSASDVNKYSNNWAPLSGQDITKYSPRTKTHDNNEWSNQNNSQNDIDTSEESSKEKVSPRKLLSPNLVLPTRLTSKMTIFSGVNGHKNYDLLPTECGKINYEHIGNKVYKQPWMALLAHNIRGKIAYRCIGTVINKLHILTTASCITQLGDGVTLAGVRVGEYDILQDKDCDVNGHNCAPPVQDLLFEDYIIHSGFNKTTMQNDIALIRVSRPIDFTKENASPICLPVDSHQMNLALENETMVGVGWPNQAGTKTQTLQEKEYVMTSTQQCRELTKGKNIFISEEQVCAENILPCSSNVGGPLMMINSVGLETLHIQHGIVTYSPEKCALANAIIFTKVSHYMEWILDKMIP